MDFYGMILHQTDGPSGEKNIRGADVHVINMKSMSLTKENTHRVVNDEPDIRLVNAQTERCAVLWIIYKSHAQQSPLTDGCTDNIDLTVPPVFMKLHFLGVWDVCMIDASSNLSSAF